MSEVDIQDRGARARAPASDPAADVLARAEALCADLDCSTVRRWKERHPGALAVGTLPVYAPRPLFEASGVLPVAVFGGGDQVDIVRGDSYFQSYICHLPRSVVELGMSGAYAPLDGMVFPSTCDVIRNLGGMWKLLFPDKYATYLDLPQNFDPALGGRFYARELRRIAGDLAARGALPLDRDRLFAAIADENERRGLIAEIDAVRRDDPARVRASEAWLAVRAGAALPAREHAALLREVLAAVRARPTRAYDNVRVVVSGAFCEQPPIGLVRTLEKAGCDIVEDDLQLGMRMVEGAIPLADGDLPADAWGPLDPGDPVDCLAAAFLWRGRPTATRYGGGAPKGLDLVERVRGSRADGVVFAAPSFCDPALLEQPMLEKALEDARIPFTSFKYAENSAQFQSIREQAGAFSDAVKLWGEPL